MTLTRRKYYLLFLSFIFFVPSSLYAREQGKPFIHNYTSKDYRAHTQNWAIVQDYKGVMYFGNTYGVLQYDGTSWQLIRTPNKSAVRSLSIDHSGNIYVGGIGEMGYLSPDSIGKLQYYSLTHLIDKEYRDFLDIWSIHVQGGKVFFQTNDYLFTLIEGKIQTLPLQGAYHKSFIVHGELFIRQDSLGLGTIKWSEWHQFPKGDIFADEPISAMLPYHEEDVLVGSRNKGLFLLKHLPEGNQSITPFPCPASQWLKKHQLYHAVRLSEDTYAFGSLSNGVIITDDQGNILQYLNTENGLNNNRIYHLHKGEDRALWIATDNGISHAEISSPLTRWDMHSGLNGTIYAINRYKNTLFAAGSSGVFTLLERSEGNYQFKNIGGYRNQVWKLLTIKGNQSQLLVATRNGLKEAIYQEGSGWVLNNIFESKQAFFDLAYFPEYPALLFVGMNNGLGVFQKENGQWKNFRKIAGVHRQIRSIAIDKQKQIWLATRHDGVISLRLDNQMQAADIKHYNTSHGLPAMHQIHLSVVDGQLLFATPKGVCRYDLQQQRFIPEHIIGHKYNQNYLGVLHVAEDNNGNIWVHAVEESENREWLEVALKYPDGSYHLDSITLKRLSEAELYCIYPDNHDITWIGGSEGLFRYDNRVHQPSSGSFHSIIRSVSIPEDSTVFFGNYPLSYTIVGEDRYLQLAPPAISIPYKLNSITFNFAAPSYENEADNRFSYYLDGHEPTWSEWKHTNHKSYFDLPEGQYTFYVKAHNIYDQESTIATYKFSIEIPWYKYTWVLIAAPLLLLTIIWSLVKLNTRRLAAEKKHLETQVWERTTTVREQKEALEQANKAVEAQKEEIASQRDRLAGTLDSMKQLSLIGLDVASILSVEELVASTYNRLNQLIDFSAFGIGFYNEESKKIEFPDAVTQEKKLPNFEYNVTDDRYLAVYCFLQQKDIFIKDYDKEQQYYLHENGEALITGAKAKSIIYIPLAVKNKPVGVLTVQHHLTNAFDNYQFNLLKNLAVYIAIAVEHAESYYLVEQQKEQIENANQEVQGSIAYAQRIQQAMLPKMQQIYHHLPDSFVLLEPRNIVSGDFHWFATKRDILGNNKVIIASVDCTGHGVPGAFMSMIGNDLLSEIVSFMGVTEADKILNQLHLLVKKALNQEDTGNNDGMDISLCVIDFHKGKVEFAGAKNPLVYVHKGQLFEVRGDKYSIGGIQREHERVFTKHSIALDPEEETTFYLFSDGFQDQFGGNKRRKFMSRRFKELLHQIHTLPMDEQKEVLHQTLHKWMENNDQVDDVLVIGFKV